MRAVHLQTEYLTEALGIDVPYPRFYWNCEGGVRQTAYRIVARLINAVTVGEQSGAEVVWDSGKVQSGSMAHIPYGGRALKSRERISWNVTLWDEKDEAGPSAESWFEMGLLEKPDWKAKWISGDYKAGKKERYPADCFRKRFFLSGEVLQARLYLTACGIYEAKLNGQRAGDFVLAPGCTDYRKRIQYQTYDVTGLLEKENTLEVQLGDGWFRGSLGAYGQIHVYGRRTSVLAQLEILYADGKKQTVVSDGSWDWSNDGPVRFNDLKDGEIYDAGKLPSYSGKAKEVLEERNLVASNNVPVREKETFVPRMIVTPSGKKVLDFGQNIAGFLEFTVQGKRGQTMKLTCGEILDEKGELTRKNFTLHKFRGEFGQMKQLLMIMGMADKVPGERIDTPKQEIHFTCSGQKDHFKNAFSVFGFRYVQVDTELQVDPEDFRAVAVYSDLEQTGSFVCSNEKVNRLYANTLWSMKGNFLDIPSDCPTRERLGWTGDAQVFFETGSYMMNIAPFFRKWLQDVEDGKMKNGSIPSVVPHCGMDLMYTQTGGSVGWGCATVLLPYRYWKCYGDRRILEQYYPLAKSYTDYMLAHMGHVDKKEAEADPYDKYVYEKGRHLGEWLEPAEFKDEIGPTSQLRQTEVSCAYFHYDVTLMAEMAEELGRKEDAALYREYADGSGKAYRNLFLKEGAPDTDRQAKLIRPIALGLADGSLREQLEKRLAKAVENRQYRIGTGFLSTPFVLKTLTEAGFLEYAYKMLENELSPGWLYEVDQGATTVWEDWEGKDSRNHYSPGAVCGWLFDTVCGIRVCGERRFQICPRPGGTLTSAKAVYHSLYGTVESAWERDGEKTVFTVSIPVNTTAEMVLPDGRVEELAPGQKQFN
ncbi:MAG: glycoside hydrolase family 78 protein [Blautia sp.]|nr:glycoside hydrolase family 78 protein [Blautia sp.]